jgi:Bacterial protein of unknown function (DUF903)
MVLYCIEWAETLLWGTPISFLFAIMKKLLSLTLLAFVFCTGCASQYTLTLNNGDRITSRGKPRYDRERNLYFFKNAQGVPDAIPASRVREVSPSSMMDKGTGSQFLPKK